MTYKDKLEREHNAQLSDLVLASMKHIRLYDWNEITDIAADNLEAMHLSSDTYRFVRRFGVADMVIANMYVVPIMETIITQGERISTRIRYSGRIYDWIQEHEFWFDNDTWLVWYNTLDCVWECDYVPF